MMCLAQVVGVDVDTIQNHPEVRALMHQVVDQLHCLALELLQLHLMAVVVVKMVLLFGMPLLQDNLQHTVQVVQQGQKIIPVVMVLALAQVAAAGAAITQVVLQVKEDMQEHGTQVVLL
jgi:hypothetical protein